MNLESKDVALTAVFAALYAALTIFQGTTAVAAVQLRIADCLLPLAALFGFPMIVGASIGCVASNMWLSGAAPNGMYDIAIGPLANFVATLVIFWLRRHRLVGCVIGSLVIGSVVGSYLWMIYVPLDIFGFAFPDMMPMWAVTIIYVTTSSLVAIAIIGYTLLRILGRSGIIQSLRSKGVKVAV